ncbi:MAG: DNA polymerase III subunit delta [Acidimicrobiales bacterium]
MKARPLLAGEGSIYLVQGSDQGLVDNTLVALLHELVGEHDPSLIVEEYGGPDADGLDVGRIVEALLTPPFLTGRRIVVVRQAGRVSTAEAATLIGILQNMIDGVYLVITSGGGTIPAALKGTVQRYGAVIDETSPGGRDRAKWFHGKLAESSLRLDTSARELLEDRVGEDFSRLEGLLAILATTYEAGKTLSRQDIEPFMGEGGTVPSWDLTDAIDAGDAALALENLHRLSYAGALHPLAILTIIYRHYEGPFRLDGASLATGEQAAEIIGTKSRFLGEKALRLSRQLGNDGISRAITLIAEADLDLRGNTALPPMTVLEILVGRLSKLRMFRAASGRHTPAKASKR